MSATCRRGSPAAGAAALKWAFCSSKNSPKMNTASMVAIATTPILRRRSGAAPASSRPRVTHEPTIMSSLAACPSESSGSANAAASRGTVRSANQGRAPCAAQPSASAHPGGTSSSAIQVRTSALAVARVIAATLPTTDSGATAAQPRPPSRHASAAGIPAAGSAMQSACAASSSAVSGSKNTGAQPGRRGPARVPGPLRLASSSSLATSSGEPSTSSCSPVTRSTLVVATGDLAAASHAQHASDLEVSESAEVRSLDREPALNGKRTERDPRPADARLERGRPPRDESRPSAVAQKEIEPRPGGEAETAQGAGRGQEDTGRRGGRYSLRAKDEHTGGGAHAQSKRQLTERDDRNEDGGGVEHGRVHSHRMEHEPVARNLREDCDQHERDEFRAAPERARDGEPLAEPTDLGDGPASQSRTHGCHGGDAQDREPPGQAEGADQGERDEGGQAGLHDQDRQLGRDEGRHGGALSRRRAPQSEDARRGPKLRVQLRAEPAHTRSPVQAPSTHAPARGANARVPGFAPREQRDYLKGNGYRNGRRRRTGDARFELVPLGYQHGGEHQAGANRGGQHQPAPMLATVAPCRREHSLPLRAQGLH